VYILYNFTFFLLQKTQFNPKSSFILQLLPPLFIAPIHFWAKSLSQGEDSTNFRWHLPLFLQPFLFLSPFETVSHNYVATFFLVKFSNFSNKLPKKVKNLTEKRAYFKKFRLGAYRRRVLPPTSIGQSIFCPNYR
jgi:hypothetical protein